MTNEEQQREWEEKLQEQSEHMRKHLEELEEQADEDKSKQQVPRPPKGDPRHTDSSVPPGQTDTPAGGSSGEYMGGSAKKKGNQG